MTATRLVPVPMPKPTKKVLAVTRHRSLRPFLVRKLVAKAPLQLLSSKVVSPHRPS